MRTSKTITLSIAAVIAVATLVIGIGATTVSNANSAYAWGNSGKKEQTKVVVLNKCANVDDKNKRTHIENVRCQINNDDISGTGFPLQPIPIWNENIK
jgi:hypothetical protein